MTINQARQKLGKLVSRIFTDDFESKYTMIRVQVPEPGKQYDIAANYAAAVDAYIRLTSQLTKAPSKLKDLATMADPMAVFGFFFRYHFVTSWLMVSDQDKVIHFPEEDGPFLVAVLIGHWSVIHKAAVQAATN